MRQLSLVLTTVVLVGCASKGKEGAPAATGGATPTTNSPPAEPPPPAPGGAGSAAPDDQGARQQAIDQTRQGGLLGPSAPTAAFDPLPDSRRKVPPKPTKTQPSTVEQPTDGTRRGGDETGASFTAKVTAITLADGKPADPALVRALRVRSADVQACYTKALAKKPALTGKLEITFTVSKTGALTAAAVKSTELKDIELESCVVNVVQMTRVTAPAAEVNGLVAFKFAKG